jgi:hypothetical protein
MIYGNKKTEMRLVKKDNHTMTMAATHGNDIRRTLDTHRPERHAQCRGGTRIHLVGMLEKRRSIEVEVE